MKRSTNPLQKDVLKRLNTGLPPTRWQRFRLHIAALWRHWRHLNLRTLWFQARGILRTCKPSADPFADDKTKKLSRKGR